VDVFSPNNNRTTYEWDAKGQLKSEIRDIYGLELRTSYEYYASGNVKKVTKPDNTVTEYRYDNAGRRIQEIVDPTGLNLVTQYEYNERDQVVAVTDPRSSKTRYVRDSADRVRFTVNQLGEVTETQYDAESRVTRVTRYSASINFSDLNNASYSRGSGADGCASRGGGRLQRRASSVENRVYDRDGRLRFVVNDLNEVTEFRYDKNGNVIDRIAYANRFPAAPPNIANLEWAVPGARDATRDDARSYRVRRREPRQIHPRRRRGVTYRQYDFRGNVTVETGTPPPLSRRTRFLSDGDFANLATSASDQRRTFVYDNAGEWSFPWMARGGHATDVRWKRQRHRAHALCQSPDGVPPTTEAAMRTAFTANAALDRTEKFHYDAAARLTHSMDALGIVTRYDYDKTNNVVRTVVSDHASGGSTWWNIGAGFADRTSRVVYDAVGRAVFEVDATGAVIENVYDAGGNVTSRIAYRNVINHLLLPITVTVAQMRSRLTLFHVGRRGRSRAEERVRRSRTTRLFNRRARLREAHGVRRGRPRQARRRVCRCEDRTPRRSPLLPSWRKSSMTASRPLITMPPDA
jgi:YD repeat-containing protein